MRLCDMCLKDVPVEGVEVRWGDGNYLAKYDLCEKCVDIFQYEIKVLVASKKPRHVSDYVKSLTPDQVAQVHAFLEAHQKP